MNPGKEPERKRHSTYTARLLPVFAGCSFDAFDDAIEEAIEEDVMELSGGKSVGRTRPECWPMELNLNCFAGDQRNALCLRRKGDRQRRHKPSSFGQERKEAASERPGERQHRSGERGRLHDESQVR